MVGHDDVGVQTISVAVVMFKDIEEQMCPPIHLKEAPAAMCLGSDKVGIFAASILPSGWPHFFPQGLKPRFIAHLDVRAEARTLPLRLASSQISAAKAAPFQSQLLLPQLIWHIPVCPCFRSY